MSADPQLGLVYLPVELPTGDYYGGHRPGNGLFGESIIAVDVKTGVRKWHYQLVHHGIWDYDIPCAPILFDQKVNGKRSRPSATDQAGLGLHVQPRDGAADLADRRAPRGEGKRAWRVVLANAAACHQATGFRSTGFQRGRPDRFHAGAERRGETDCRQLQVGTDLHDAAGQHVAPSSGHVDVARGHGRRELAGWLTRSGDELPVHLRELGCAVARHGQARPDPIRYGLRVRDGARDPNAAPTTGRGGGGGGEGGGGLTVQGLPLTKPPYATSRPST